MKSGACPEGVFSLFFLPSVGLSLEALSKLNNLDLDVSSPFNFICNCSTSRASFSFSSFSLLLLSCFVSFLFSIPIIFSSSGSSSFAVLYCSFSFFFSAASSIISEILFTKSIPNIAITNAIIAPKQNITVPISPNNSLSGSVNTAPIEPPPTPSVPKS